MSILRLTPEQYAAAQKRAQQRPKSVPCTTFTEPPPPLQQKYRNRATGGYASAKEARRAEQLKMMQNAGLIRELREQVLFLLIPKQVDEQGKQIERACIYIADFVYQERQRVADNLGPANIRWAEVVEDCKGMRTPDYIIKRKLMLHVHSIRVRET